MREVRRGEEGRGGQRRAEEAQLGRRRRTSDNDTSLIVHLGEEGEQGVGVEAGVCASSSHFGDCDIVSGDSS